MNNYERELIVVKEVIRRAGGAAMMFYGGEVGEQFKVDKSPVTEADLASDGVLLEGLKEFGYAILSEESEDDLVRLEMERVWVIDPLDGTKDFIQQTGDFSVMVALAEGGSVVLGAVYRPEKEELYYAVKGGGAFVEKDGEVRRLRVSGRDDFGEFRMLVSRNHLLDAEQKMADELGIEEMVKCGSAGLKSSLIAADEADLYLNTSDRTFEWDIGAAEIIVREAGGIVTDMDGKKILYNKRDPRNLRGFVISNGRRHREVVASLGAFLVPGGSKDRDIGI